MEAGSGPILRPSGASRALASAPMTPGLEHDARAAVLDLASRASRRRAPPAPSRRSACPERLVPAARKVTCTPSRDGQGDEACHLVAGDGLHHDLRHEPVEAGVGAEGQRPERIAHHAIGGEEGGGLVPEPPVRAGERQVIGSDCSRHAPAPRFPSIDGAHRSTVPPAFDHDDRGPYNVTSMESAPTCPRCGRENDSSFAFCHGCGQALRPEAERTCARCGAKLPGSFRFCGHCGQAADLAPPGRPTSPSSPRAPVVAAPEASPRSRRAVPAGAGPARRPCPGPSHPLDREVTICGRREGDLLLPEDGSVSPRHAAFTVREGRIRVEDLGIGLRAPSCACAAPRSLTFGDEIRLGRQLLRLEPMPRPPASPRSGDCPGARPIPGYRARLVQLLEGGGLGEVLPLRAGASTIGPRERRRHLPGRPLRLGAPRPHRRGRGGRDPHRPRQLQRDVPARRTDRPRSRAGRPGPGGDAAAAGRGLSAPARRS